jgi:phosphatidylglycerophosphate synthase
MSASPAARTDKRRGNLIRWGALGLGVVLFCATLYYINFPIALGTIRRLGVALPLALVFSGLWHLVRTWAWAWCFPQPRTVSFLRLARVRLSAEAFSYLTLRGIAGEPLKVVLLADRVDARQATAAVALERLAYLVGTTIIIGIGSLAAIAGLPLTRVWFRVFRAFAIGAAALTMLAVVVIAGRGDYVQSLLRRLDRFGGSSVSQGRVGRFIIAVERQMLDLVRGNPLRLLVLLTAALASYLLMALEAWVILRGSGVDITPNAALAVETFSRVASFASAFIPANLGALEASSLAAASAVGAAAAGGAALALARRLRGLFWAGLGLAIYPRGSRPAVVPADENGADHPRHPRATLLYLPVDDGAPVAVDPGQRLAGLSIAERVLRSARRARYERIVVWLPPTADARTQSAVRAAAVAVGDSIVIASNAAEWDEAIRQSETIVPMTAIGPGCVVSPALLTSAQAISASPGEIQDVAAGLDWPQSGVIRVSAADAHDPRSLVAALALRRARVGQLPSGADVSDGRAALALRIVDSGDLRQAEATIRRSSYKETDATVARFNRRLSLPISVALIRTPLTANQLSVILVGLGFYSAWLFSLGHYWTGALGAFLSLAASVLDGCDGEIARLKYQESALGCWIETAGDYSYYIAIFIGLSVGAVKSTRTEIFYWFGGAALAGSLVTFALLVYLRSRITAGQPDKLHAVARDRFRADETLWSRLIWRLSFVATRSAMPYGIMVFALLNMLPAIVLLAAIGSNVYWFSLVLKLRHLLADEETVVA